MKEWLEEIVEALEGLKREDRQFLSAVCVACCLRECDINYSMKKKGFLEPLIKFLRVRPDVQRRECLQYILLKDHVEPVFRYAGVKY